ncbi:MAG TPA: DUF1223 domain-containing protein [Puia sp.]|nr:DUF1223 domain-containing protein [Puia sp.]
MKKIRIFLPIVLPLVIVVVAGFGHRSATGSRAAGAFPAFVTSTAVVPHILSSAGFAVVELFTSEGCSSCPPADRALAELAGEFPGGVYVLEFHVDYWNRLGWKDIYSDEGYTNRQQEYARVFRLESIYTPEAVVNGHKEMVGSDQRQLQASVKAELEATTNHSLGLVADATEKKVVVQYNTKEGGILHAALVQLTASSQILGGENKGLHLQHINVVRNFATVDLKNAKDPGSSESGRLELSIPEGITAKDCKVIAFVQDHSSRIVAAEDARIK